MQGGAPATRSGAAAARSDEGLKAVVAAYEAKQAELGKENRDLKAALASLQVGGGGRLLVAGGGGLAGGQGLFGVGARCNGELWLLRQHHLISGLWCLCCLWCLLAPPCPLLPPLSCQAEYKDVLNRAVRQQQAEASSSRSAAADAAADDAFLKSECPGQAGRQAGRQAGGLLPEMPCCCAVAVAASGWTAGCKCPCP